MDFLRYLATLRTPFLDSVMSFITGFGEELLFIVIALTFFWCVNKKQGYYLLFVGVGGTLINQILKMIFRIPRPWILDPDFEIVESARAQATGYSFPSGHTQTATSLYGGLARSSKRIWVRILFVILLLAVGFSRMYLGVHTPKDVLVSLAVGTLLVFLLYPIVFKAFSTPTGIYALLLTVLAIALGNLIFLKAYPFPPDVDAVNLADAVSNAWKLLGATLAMCFVYPLDRYFIRFETSAVWWAQILKLVVGFAAVVAVRTFLKEPLNSLLGSSVGGAVRYFFVVIVAGVVVPFFFRFLPKPRKQTR